MSASEHRVDIGALPLAVTWAVPLLQVGDQRLGVLPGDLANVLVAMAFDDRRQRGGVGG